MYNCTRILLLNHLGGGPVVRAWDQEVCSLYGPRFEPCGYLYDGHWRLTWSLISGLVRLVEMRASWPDTYVKLKKKNTVTYFIIVFCHRQYIWISKCWSYNGHNDLCMRFFFCLALVLQTDVECIRVNFRQLSYTEQAIP
jgi:hypothetical protein